MNTSNSSSTPLRGGDRVHLIGEDVWGSIVKIRNERIGFEYLVKWPDKYLWHQGSKLILIDETP